jgi:hypothetical protein
MESNVCTWKATAGACGRGPRNGDRDGRLVWRGERATDAGNLTIDGEDWKAGTRDGGCPRRRWPAAVRRECRVRRIAGSAVGARKFQVHMLPIPKKNISKYQKIPTKNLTRLPSAYAPYTKKEYF